MKAALLGTLACGLAWMAAAPARAQSPADAPSAVSMHQYQGTPVREVQFRGLYGSTPEKLRALVQQKAGEPFDRLKVQQSIRTLYATGRFSDIAVEAEPAPEQALSLVFVVRENYFVGHVGVRTSEKSSPSPTQLANALKLQLGEQFTKEKMDQGLRDLQTLMRQDGFYRATVTPSFTYQRENQVIDVAVDVDPGPRAAVGTVTVEGDAGFTATEICDIAKLHPGDSVTANRIRRALERVRQRYQKLDRLEAQVALVTPPLYHAPGNTVDYVFRINRGPTADVHIEGAKLRQGLIKKYVPIYEENAVDEDLLNEGRRNLRDYFQSQGYFDVQVSYRQESVPADEHQHIFYTVDKGPRHTLKEIVLDGNHYFDNETLRERMLIQNASWFMIHGRFSQALLSRDVETLENLYRDNGFQQVKVSPEVDDDYQDVTGRMRVVLHVFEGPQTRVGTLTLEGNRAFPAEVLRQLLTSTEGQPFSQTNLAADHDSVVNFYFNHGFPDVQLDMEGQPAPSDPLRVNVTYKLSEGRRVFVDRVLTSGLVHTRPYVVEREMQVHPDDPLDQSAMLDTQRRLYDLGIFSQVDLAPENPQGEEAEKNVMLQVEEARRYSFTYGFGLEVQTGSEPGTTHPQGRTGVSPRGSLDVTRLNFLGRDHTITFKGRLGRLQQRGLLSYEAPRWFNRENFKLTFAAFYDNTADVRTFTSSRLEGSVEIQQKWSRVTTLLYRFAYRRVKVDPSTLVIDPALIPTFSKPVRVGMPSFTYIRDKRDDPLDSHKGNYTALDAGISSSVFGSEASFSRLLFLNSTYHSFGKRHKFVFARSTRIGVEQPYSSIIPLPELFYSGGGNSHRGFALNQAGPRDPVTGFPIGGQALFVNNFELRLPPMNLPLLEDNVSFVLFHDMGNVFAQAGDMLPGMLRWNQPNRDSCLLLTPTATCNFNYNSNAIGAGLRYKTLIGPVRFDFSYNLNPPLFPIRQEGRADSLSHFNFYFSIGQTF